MPSMFGRMGSIINQPEEDPSLRASKPKIGALSHRFKRQFNKNQSPETSIRKSPLKIYGQQYGGEEDSISK